MTGTLYLAWRYLVYHRVKTAILVTSITLIVYLPVGLDVLVSQSAAQLTARAEATPLLVGARGSPLELVLNSIYFRAEVPEPVGFAELARINGSGLGLFLCDLFLYRLFLRRYILDSLLDCGFFLDGLFGFWLRLDLA